MIDPQNTARAFRATSAWLEEDIDAVSRILMEFDGDAAALEDIVLTLLRLLCHEITSGDHGAAWAQYIVQMLVGPLPGVPDIIPDFGP
jgi:hypothetical protein